MVDIRSLNWDSIALMGGLVISYCLYKYGYLKAKEELHNEFLEDVSAIATALEKGNVTAVEAMAKLTKEDKLSITQSFSRDEVLKRMKKENIINDEVINLYENDSDAIEEFLED